MSSQPLRPPVPAILLVVLLASPALAGCAAPGNGPPAPDVTFASAMDDGQAVTGASPTPVAPPTDLVGLDGTTVEHWFGKPGLVRRDFPAEVWQYRNQACVLDV